MKDVEKIALEAILRAAVVGAELAHDIEGRIKVQPIVCPYCMMQHETWEEATAHDGLCQKHPGVVRALRAESRIAELEAALASRTVEGYCVCCGRVREFPAVLVPENDDKICPECAAELAEEGP